MPRVGSGSTIIVRSHWLSIPIGEAHDDDSLVQRWSGLNLARSRAERAYRRHLYRGRGASRAAHRRKGETPGCSGLSARDQCIQCRLPLDSGGFRAMAYTEADLAMAHEHVRAGAQRIRTLRSGIDNAKRLGYPT